VTRRLVAVLVSLTICFVLLGGILFSPAAFAQEEEMLLFKEMPMVTTASRKATRLEESSAAVFVITAEDIKQSGATAIPELLRMAPGMNVVQVTASNYSVGIRDLNKIPADLVLVMIDNQVIYSDHQGETAWDSIPISLGEIDRIEIVRGAGSVLYGANAYQGVINIITKKVRDMDGTLLSFTVGNRNTTLATMIHSERSDKMGYRISVSHDEVDQWSTTNSPVDESKDVNKANWLMDYYIDDESKLTASIGYSDGTVEYGNYNVLMFQDDTQSWLATSLRYERPDFTATIYRRFLDRRKPGWTYLTGGPVTPAFHVEQELVIAEFQHTLRPVILNNEHEIIWGIVGQKKYVKSPGVQKDIQQREGLWGVFFQDEFSPRENLTLTTGIRYDYHPLTQDQWSPRIGMVYSPKQDHYLRASWSRAFRCPTMSESFIEYVDLSGGFGAFWYVQGNEELDPMTIDSFELGYTAPVNDRLKGTISLFYNLMDDYIERRVGAATALLKYVNGEDAVSYGFEVAADFIINSWLSGMANYSYALVKESTQDPFITYFPGNTPKHKFNLGLRAKKDNISANLLLHYTSHVMWPNSTDYPLIATWGGGKAPGYIMLNGRIAYAFSNDNAEIALAASNLLGDEHFEYSAIEVGRRILGTLSFKF